MRPCLASREPGGSLHPGTRTPQASVSAPIPIPCAVAASKAGMLLERNTTCTPGRLDSYFASGSMASSLLGSCERAGPAGGALSIRP